MRISDLISDVGSSDLNYGGRWVSLQLLRKLWEAQPELAARTQPIEESQLAQYLSMAYAPEPDLFIRTGGEQRISNFLIWQLAYTELYFSDDYWPDFGAKEIDTAFAWRSEEHTSELQSLMAHLVCRLLLEKKNTQHNLA